MDKSIQELVAGMIQSGKVPPELSAALAAAMSDPAKLEAALAALKAMGADQVGSGAPLNIADYYRPGAEKYELRWELPSHLPVPVAFEELDRKSQFFVLFQEWSRRELDGMMELNGGDVDGATAVFEECVERARQIEVAELEARSYEGLMRVAQKRGDRKAELEWSRKATAARRA